MSKTRSEIDGPSRPVVVAVDDEPDALAILERALRRDFRFLGAKDGPECLALIEPFDQVDVLMVDQRMPQMKGTELLRIVNERRPDAATMVKILVTGYTDPQDIIESVNVGQIDYYLAKPFAAGELPQKIRQLLAFKGAEKRAVMRVALGHRQDIAVTVPGQSSARLIDLSEHGALLETSGFVPERAILPVTFVFPDNERVQVSGQVVRADRHRGEFGLVFGDVSLETRSIIQRFLSEHLSVADLPALKQKYPFLRTESMHVYADPEVISERLDGAQRDKLDLAAIHISSRRSVGLALVEMTPGQQLVLGGENLHTEFATGEPIFVSLRRGFVTYSFETTVSQMATDGRRLVCLYPRVLFSSEKRSEARTASATRCTVEIPLPPPFSRVLEGRVLEISPHGLSFGLQPGQTDWVVLPGTPLPSIRVLEDGQLLREECAEVRHVAEVREDGLPWLRIGLQCGLARRVVEQHELAPAAATASRAPVLRTTAPDQEAPQPDAGWTMSDMARQPPQLVRFYDEREQELVGLLNSAQPLTDEPAPVFLLPPAFGKTKETLFALTLTLTSNYAARGRQAIVLRYDGVGRKGESHKAPEARQPGYEMTRATFTQGAADIAAAVRWVRANPRFKCSCLVLVTFSLSTLEARLALRDANLQSQVDYWIPCMGTPELQNILSLANCGLDLVEQHQLGIKMGLRPVWGCLVNIDEYVGDAVRNGLATVAEGRRDFQSIQVPMTWIYGENDFWVDRQLVKDVMSVDAQVRREVLAVPLGHNARTSAEAMRLFATVASLAFRFSERETLQPLMPSPEDVELMRRLEKDRLPPRPVGDATEYWRRYLVGEEQLIGFDVLTLSDDYRDFMTEQVAGLELRAGDAMCDLGGGTGNSVPHIFSGSWRAPHRLTVADLVPQALEKAEVKLQRAVGRGWEGQWETRVVNAQLSPYWPMKHFLAGEYHHLRQLGAALQSWPVHVLDQMVDHYSTTLHRVLRGAPITPAISLQLERDFEQEALRVIHDLNLAARWVLGRAGAEEHYHVLDLPLEAVPAEQLPFADAQFDKILMSLLLPYLMHPVETLRDIRRILRPGGRVVVSSLVPDADLSGIVTRLVAKVEATESLDAPEDWTRELILESTRSLLNDAQTLVEIEESGAFKFFAEWQMERYIEEAGLTLLGTHAALGSPPQGYFCVAMRSRDE